MALPEGWVETWEAIGKVVGRSEDTCQRLATRDLDPLPVTKYGGRMAAKRVDLLAWFEREVSRERAA